VIAQQLLDRVQDCVERVLAGGFDAQDTTAFGVLFITLRDGAYDWRFVSAAGGDFSDAGLTRCH